MSRIPILFLDLYIYVITISLALFSAGTDLFRQAHSHFPVCSRPAREIAIQDDVNGRHEEGTDRRSGSRWVRRLESGL